jgi:hypothetical protein
MFRNALLALFAVLLATAHASAEERFLKLPLGRDATAPVYWMSRPDATATVLLLPGGDGGIGHIVDGKPTGNNFLVRSRDLFYDNKLNVLVMGRASDFEELGYADRLGEKHRKDLEAAVDFAQQQGGKPVWIVGTSRGTVSGASAAIGFGKAKLAGLVLTSSVTDNKHGSVPGQKLSAITIPVLVVHHKRDGCKTCRPEHAGQIMSGLDSAPVKKLVFIDAGSGATGDPCKSQHWHGYINAEKEVVDLIAAWIRNPAS